MTWRKTLHGAVHDNDSGLPSSTRIAVLVASLTLSFSTIVLTFAVLWKVDLVPALSVVGGALGGMAGVSYTAQRAWSGKSKMTREYEGE